MRKSANLIVLLTFVLAAVLAAVISVVAVDRIESQSVRSIAIALETDALEWADVKANGLQVELTGTAPSEAARFRALTVAGTVVDAHRIIDGMAVTAAAEIAAPRFSIEILRNDDGISLIGLIPTATNRDQIMEGLGNLGDAISITDLLESADYPAPAGWDAALDYALEALTLLPRSKISIDANVVAITAISDSAEARARLERQLMRRVPEGLRVVLDISAPRPVITPFTLRFVIDGDGARFDACSADTEAKRARILSTARKAGLEGEADCTIGLGNPSPHWALAVETGINALVEIGAGSLTFSDADVTLVAGPETPQATFDRVVGELETELPAVFSLHAVLPEPVQIDGSGESAGPPEFVATLSPEGFVQLRGRLTDQRVRGAVESYARARFGLQSVYAATRLDPELPDGWPLRVLAALEVLSHLSNGSVVVQPDFVDLKGVTGDPDANAEIARILSDKLGAAENFAVAVTYVESLDPAADLPTPQECVDNINEVLTSSKINFAPGSETIDPGARETLTKIADLMRDCSEVKMEIAGHTDSQGREEMNETLSQRRAGAVLQALMARRVLTSNLTAKGYGESRPIADNETEEGREANRRIEFTLITDDPAPEIAADDTDPEQPAEQEPADEPSEEPEATPVPRPDPEAEPSGQTDEQN